MDFTAIDVETANCDMASICQIGIAKFRQGKLVDEWKSLINPEDWFDEVNISIHGITPEAVKNSPTLPMVHSKLAELLSGEIVVSHTHFDRTSLHQALRAYDLHHIDCTWLDSARVARRTWEDCAYSGYGLAALAEKLGIEFNHHDALEDAKASGLILLAACEKTGIDCLDWMQKVKQPINPTDQDFTRAGKENGYFHGETICFTGALCIPRREAADLAAGVGFDVTNGVTKKTTVLVVGDQDVTKLAGHTKSSKHRKAEALIGKGIPIKIIRETDFQRYCELATN